MPATNPILPDTFHFSIGGYNGGCHDVEWTDGALRLRRADAAYAWNNGRFENSSTSQPFRPLRFSKSSVQCRREFASDCGLLYSFVQ